MGGDPAQTRGCCGFCLLLQRLRETPQVLFRQARKGTQMVERVAYNQGNTRGTRACALFCPPPSHTHTPIPAQDVCLDGSI